MANIDRLASLGLALALVLGSRGAGAFELKQTVTGQSLRWDQGQVAFEVDPSVEAAVPGGADAVARAVAVWSGVGGAPALSTTAGAGGGGAAVDGRNTILLAPDGYAPAGDALAVTVLSYDDATGALVDADIVVNGTHAFAVLAAAARGAPGSAVSIEAQHAGDADGSFDLEHVVAHEVGHALGLGDVQQDDAVMYAYSMPGDASGRAPEADDALGLSTLYQVTPSRASCGQASLARSRPGPSDVWETVALGGALALGFALRRRRWARWRH